MKPNYTHDCDACIFVGKSEKVDYYLCSKKKDYPINIDTNYIDYIGDTIIARYSDDGPDYNSGIIFAKSACERNDYEDDLVKCLSLAIEQGYVKKPVWFKK